MPNALSLTYDDVPLARVGVADRDALWDVYRRHFNADRAEMDASLARAERVIRFRERFTGKLRGLVVYSLRQAEHEGRRFFWLWAGALAIDRACRGKLLLERSGMDVLLRFRVRRPTAPLFWIYESNSFQSFRMMARNFDVYWPHPERDTPPWEAGLVDRLAREKFGDRWDPTTRVLRPTGTKHVRRDSAETRASETDPLRAFYRSVNPHAEEGAAIVIVAALNLRNATSLVKRTVERMVP
jgi:hypothetical protein